MTRTMRLRGSLARLGGPASVALVLLLAAAQWQELGPAPELRTAYIGPGAGFAFLGSFLGLVFGTLAALASFLVWPLRMMWRSLRRGRTTRRASARRLIILGLDGLEPRLVDRFLSEGKLPAFESLRAQGCCRPLRTTFPALSPVAWSTFATGVHPAKHGIFDFLSRDPATYLPELSSSRVHEAQRVWRLGRYRIPLSRPQLENRRKSRSFWRILGDHGVAATILRVPITFPPEKFNGKLLSAMCTPDLLGTQGTFSLYTTRERHEKVQGGYCHSLKRSQGRLEGSLTGPPNRLTGPGEALRLDFDITPNASRRTAELRIGGGKHTLREGEYSPWVQVRFSGPFGLKAHGLCRFLVLETGPEFSMYVTPINIDPEKPALPVSHPGYYANYLAKLIGPYATLGLAEDTWALNEGVLSPADFLRQAYDIFAERERMLFGALERANSGVVACVFDTPDRVQHLFLRDRQQDPGGMMGDAGGVIEDLYRRMDALLSKVIRFVDAGTVLMVVSDHGFDFFHRGVDLNAWLRHNGYLTLTDGAAEGGEGLAGVDWSRTKAYALGLAGIYVNREGRESRGAVPAGGPAEALKQELIERLTGLRDEECGAVAINRVCDTKSLYSGPYLDAAPDLLVAYNKGYRASWGTALGRTGARVFEDNRRAWCADHCFDPRLIPGVFLCNRMIESDDPGLEDLAPTALRLFGIDPPPYMDGRPLFSPGGTRT